MGVFTDAFNRASLIQAETVINANTAVRVGEGLKFILNNLGGEAISFTAGATLTGVMKVGMPLIASANFASSAVGGSISGYDTDGNPLTRTLKCFVQNGYTNVVVDVTTLSFNYPGGTIGIITSITASDINVMILNSTNGVVSAANLSSDVIDLIRGVGSSSTNLVDFEPAAILASKTYSRSLLHCSRNMDRLKLYVKAQFQAKRDTGGLDVVQCLLQRNPDPDGVGSWTTIHTRSYRLDGDGWTTVIVDTIDTSAIQGDNYYRVVATNTVGGLNWFSDEISYLIFGVPIF